MASDGNFGRGTGRLKIPARAYYPVLGTGLAANINADFMTVIVPLWALPLYPLSPWFPALVALQMMTGLLGNLAWIGAQTLIARMCRGDPHYLGMFSFASRVGSIGAPTVIGLIWDLTGYWGAFAACTLAGLALFASTALVPHWAENQGLKPRPQSAPAAEAGPRWRDLLPRLSEYREVLALLALPPVALGIAIALLRHTPSTIQASFYITYLTEIGLQATVIGALISCAEVTGAFGSLLAAPLMRRFPAHWILVVFTVLTIAMMALTPLLGGIVALLGAAQFLRGSAHGLLHPATFSVISRALDGENQARGVALRTTGNRLGAVVLPVVMGFIAEAVGVAASFVIIGGGLLLIVAVIAVMVARTESFAGR